MSENEFDVVVIGAGMAGLAAGRALAEAGLRVVLVEGRDRVGGRILTTRTGDEVVELGAEFVHGRPQELWDLIEEAGLESYERTGEFLQGGEGGFETEADEDEEPLEDLKTYAGPDMAFAEYVKALGLTAAEKAEAIGYVEGFNAADAEEASIVALGRQQVAEDAIEGDRVWRVKDGYDRVPAFLRERFEAAGGRVALGACVSEIAWKRGRVVVKANHRGHGGKGESTESFVAGRAVVTLPLGVLQSGVVRFSPEPAGVMAAARRMRMGQVCRFTMVFKKRLWPEGMSFLMSREAMPPVWWSAWPSAGLTMTGWVGGPRSAELIGVADLQGRAVSGLAEALAISEDEIRGELVGFYSHDWAGDEFARGAYSWVPVGGADASTEMGVPVEGTLFFAGEHTDTSGHWGTVHAALRSGLRVVEQVLEAVG